MHQHIAKCCFTLAGNPNIYGKQNNTINYENYNKKRITVVSYIFLGCYNYIDHIAGYLLVLIIKMSKLSFLLSHPQSHFCSCAFILECKFPLFSCYLSSFVYMLRVLDGLKKNGSSYIICILLEMAMSENRKWAKTVFCHGVDANFKFTKLKLSIVDR